MNLEPLPLELAENREMSCIATSALKQHKQKRDVLMILVLLSPSEHCIHVQLLASLATTLRRPMYRPLE